ncbi:MAG: Gfo/Idh/MocA family oxidoreductase [Saprospiraceae bacterium]|nr:Gfo/Idh/MocA family oxidoreductase [Saprospiraceae bacterium]
MRDLTIGFIGAGDISVLHAEAIAQIPFARLKGLWNITDDLANEKCRLFNCHKYPTAESLVNDPEIDAVFILTVLESHHKYTLMALHAGKHVYVEKPVGMTVAEIEEMALAAEAAGKVCMPGHNYIYEPGVVRTKELLHSGKLGHLVSLYVLYNIQHPEIVAARMPGVIRQILTHHAYITLFLAGEPWKVSAMKSTIHYEIITQEDLAMATLKMKNGALVHLCASFAADDHAGDPWTMMIKAIGTKGATRYSYRDWVENIPAQVHSQTYSAYPYTILNADQYFLENCIRRNEEPHSTLEDAIIAQKMVEAVEVSISEERVVTIQ